MRVRVRCRILYWVARKVKTGWWEFALAFRSCLSSDFSRQATDTLLHFAQAHWCLKAWLVIYNQSQRIGGVASRRRHRAPYAQGAATVRSRKLSSSNPGKGSRPCPPPTLALSLHPQPRRQEIKTTAHACTRTQEASFPETREDRNAGSMGNAKRRLTFALSFPSLMPTLPSPPLSCSHSFLNLQSLFLFQMILAIYKLINSFCNTVENKFKFCV